MLIRLLNPKNRFNQMTYRCQLFVALAVIVCLTPSVLHADIRNWQTDERIPGTEGITPGPGVQLDHRELEYAKLSELDLTGANFEMSNLANAYLRGSTLTDANMTGANLDNANLINANLTDANLTDAVVTRTNFGGFASGGITIEQLYSTASYKAKNLQGIGLSFNNLTGWDFSGQNVAGAGFDDTTSRGFTKEQLYSTTSYQAKDLRGIGLSSNNLTGWDFGGQNITGADFSFNLNKRQGGLTEEQLYSTASYQAKDLQDISLHFNDLTGWDFSGQNLAKANLNSSTLTNANLIGANLAEASLFGATLTNANLTDANFANTFPVGANLVDADLTGANLRNAILAEANLTNAIFSAGTVYNQWTAFPDGFNPKAQGLTFIMSAAGDFDGIDGLDVTDVDLLSEWIRTGCNGSNCTYGSALFDMFNLNNDTVTDQEDLRIWVQDLKGTYFGDANLDGEFNSGDFVQVFQSGKYETDQIASWSDGDWNGDARFNSVDFVVALQDGGYELGPRASVAAVPEPSAAILLTLGLLGIGRIRKR